MAETAVVLESYFEGNHGDHEVYLLLSGPRVGETVVASDVHHMNGEYGWGVDFVDWICSWSRELLEYVD